MSRRAFRLLMPAGFLFGLAVVLVPQMPRAWAQKKAEPVVVPPQFPTITSPPTFGVKRGTTADLTFAGTNLANPTGVLVPAPLKATLVKEAKAGDGTKIPIKVEAPAGTPIGLYPFRIATSSGISNPRALVVDELPEVQETAGNTTKDMAQEVPVPCVVLGKAEAEAADYYKVKVNAGQKLTFEVLGRRLGSAIDPIVVLHDGKTKREMIALYADDTSGLQSDARLTHTFREPGSVIVEVRDTTYRGGANYAYRLRIGEFPGVTTAYPLAIQRGKTASIGFSGPGAESLPPVSVTAPTDPAVLAVRVVPKAATGVSGWPVAVAISDYPEGTEVEPNNEVSKATPVPVPGGVSARFGMPNDLDFFKIAGKKGQKLTVAVQAYELNAPTEVLMRVQDAAGKELAKSNPALPAVKAEFTPAADGDYFVVCEHLNYLAGPNEVYHLSVLPATPDFEFALPLDVALAPAGGGTAVQVTGITRLNGFTGPIELSIVGDPALSGSVIVPADGATAYVPLQVKAGTKPGAYGFRVQGKAKVGTQDVVNFASTADLVKTALAGLANPPHEYLGQAAVAVTDQAPFVLTVFADPAPVEKGKAGKLTVEVKRNGYDGEIVIASAFAAPNVTVTPKPIAKGTTKAEAAVAVAAGAAAGFSPVILKATAKIAGKDYVVTALPASVTVIDAKKAEPKKQPAKPKEKDKK